METKQSKDEVVCNECKGKAYIEEDEDGITKTCHNCEYSFGITKEEAERLRKNKTTGKIGGDSKADFEGAKSGKDWLLKKGETKEELAERAGEPLQTITKLGPGKS